MADKSELQHIPRAVDALVLSEARSSLIVRASNDAKAIMARKPEPALRAKVKLNGKWGLIDKTGRFVVEPFCYEIRDFSCGMAAFSSVQAQRNRKLYQGPIEDLSGRQDKPLERPIDYYGYYLGNWGFVDVNWCVAIPAKFKWVRNFSEDMAGVFHNGKWGFLSKDGSFAIDPRFDVVGDFSEGMCIVKLNEMYGVIDRSGEFAVKPGFNYLWDFSEGLACAEIDKKYGFINRTGEIVILPAFESAQNFNSGVAQVELNDKSCLIDAKGSLIFTCTDEFVIGARFAKERIGSFSNNVALVSGRYRCLASTCGHDVQECDGVCKDDPCSCEASSLICETCSSDYQYFIDNTGRSILMPEGIEAMGDFSEGLGRVGKIVYNEEIGQSLYRYGYIDNRGVVKIELQFWRAEDFADGTASVYTDQEEWRLIDKEGNFVDAAGSAEDSIQKGLIIIEANGLYGFSDEMGRVLIEPKFAWLDYFSNGMARFNTSRFRDGKWGFIDRKGEIVIPPQFDEAQDFEILSPSILGKTSVG